MSSIRISCTICYELYKTTDEIFSTGCGHIFHQHCIRQWQTQSTCCPSCRSYNSNGHKIYLNFEEGSNGSEEKVNQLKKHLEESVLNASTLQKSLDDSNRNIVSMQTQFSEYEERIMELNRKNDYLTIQNESRANDLESKTIEIHRLQEALNATPNSQGGSCVVLQQEISILKEKFNQISLELKKEIRNSTELTVDKMKLQTMLEHATKPIKPNKNNENNSARSLNTEEKRNANVIPSSSRSQLAQNNTNIEGVIIKNVPNKFTDSKSLTDYAFKIVQLMNVPLKIEDIENVSIMERKNTGFLSLLIKFATLSAKVMFLANKIHLKGHEETKNLLVLEYVAKNTNSLFNEAKSLKTFGYKVIYCKNNKVYVKKHEKSIPIVIRSKKQIDDLKNKPEESSAEREESNGQKDDTLTLTRFQSFCSLLYD